MRIFFTCILFFGFAFSCLAQIDAKVEAVYTLAKIPLPLGVYRHVVEARIINKGTEMLVNLPVTLTVSGANDYTDTRFADIVPGDTTLISFNSFSPWNTGTNTVTVSVPADDNSSNNSLAYTQQVNNDTYSYADNSSPISSIGYGNADGMLLTRYNVSGSAVVKKVKVFISSDAANLGNTVYGVVVNFGTIIGQSEAHVITAIDLGAYLDLDIIDPPDVDFDFYVGLLQTANATTPYYPVSFQHEGIPTRPDAYFGCMANGSGLTSLNYFGRLMIQAVVDIGTVSPFNASILTPNKVIAGWDFSDVNSPENFAATTYDTLLSSSNLLTRSAAVPSSAGVHSFRSAGFQNSGIAITNPDYYQFTLSPEPGDTLSLSAIGGYLHGNSSDISTSPVISRFAYSTDGINFSLISSNITANEPIENFTVSLSAIAALQNIVNGTTITIRYFASGLSASAGWGFISPQPGYDGLAVYGKLVTSNTIFTSPVVPTGAAFTLNDCDATATGSIAFTSTGDFAPDNQYIVQLGQIYQPHFNVFRFKFPASIGALASNAHSGVINFTIPAGTPAFDPYALRIISTKPYVEGTLSQPFVINTNYCHSQATDKFRSKATGNWNDINSWESSNGTEWIAATLVPNENAVEIAIEQSDTIDISSNRLVTNTIVKGTLRLLNDGGNKGMISIIDPPAPNPFSVALKIDTSGVLQFVSGSTVYNDAVLFAGGKIKNAGRIMIGDGITAMAGGFDGFVTDNTGNITWLAGSVFEWNSVSGAAPVTNTFFPDGSEAPIFRITNIPGGTLGNDENFVVNGLLEANAPVSFTGTGTKTFRDGIKGTSTLTQAAGTGQFIVNSMYEEIPATANTVAAYKGILDGTVNIQLSTNGLLLEAGARLPDSAKVQLSGHCTTLQKLELTAGAKLTLNAGAELQLDNADLVNAGLINGTGQLQFTGDMLSGLSSAGFTAAPILISNKQLYLGSNSRTANITLAAESNLRLDTYNLYMDGVSALVADSVNFIVTNDTGRLSRYIVSDPVLFPVGTSNGSYTPVTISNSGNEDFVKGRVAQGIQTASPLTEGNVDRTWFIGDTAQTGMHLSLLMRWTTAEEQPLFDHTSCYISHYTATGYYDATLMGAANPGNNYFTLQRNDITHFKTQAFIVSSRPFVYTFTGSGDWNDAFNWTPNLVAPPIIPAGIEVIINGTGECIYTGDIILQSGGKLTVQPGKQLKITGNLNVE